MTTEEIIKQLEAIQRRCARLVRNIQQARRLEEEQKQKEKERRNKTYWGMASIPATSPLERTPVTVPQMTREQLDAAAKECRQHIAPFAGRRGL